MNFLLLCPENFLTEQQGGVTTYTLNLAQYLAQKKHSVTMLIPGPNAQVARNGFVIVSRRLGYEKKSGLLFKIKCRFFATLRKFLPNLSWSIEWSYTVYEYVRDNGPFDVIESPEWSNGFFFTKLLRPAQKTVSKLHRSSLLYKVDNMLSFSAEDYLVNAFEMISTLLSDAITSPNKFMISRYARTLSLYRKKVQIIKYGLDLGTRAARSVKKKSKTPYVLFVGRVEKAKGCAQLVNAFSLLLSNYPHLKLIFVGEDTRMLEGQTMVSYIQHLKSIIQFKKMSRRVFFKGRQHEPKLGAYYQHAELVAVPSMGNENQPLVILESMKHGKAVVASRTGGIPEMIKHGVNGLLYEQHDSQALAAAISALLTNHRLKKQIEENNLQKIKAYDLEKNGQLTLELYQSL